MAARQHPRRCIKAAQTEAAVRLARSYLEAKQMNDAAVWTERAAILGHVDSLLQFADWCDKGEVVKRDPDKVARFRYLGHYYRGVSSLRAGRYDDALSDLKDVCASKIADAEDYEKLGLCYRMLNHWDEAVAAYIRSVELDVKREQVTGVVLNLLEGLTCAERPAQLLQFLQSIKTKGWELPTDGASAAKYSALFHGFQAIALRITGKDASGAEGMMRQFTGKPDFAITNWTWEELDKWLKTTKLAPDLKVQAERIVSELKGSTESLLEWAERYENGTGVKVDVKKAIRYRYLAHKQRGTQLFRDHRYADALSDLRQVCESAEADTGDLNMLAECFGKLERWDEAIKSYTNSIGLDLKSGRETGVVLNLLEALTCAERPEQLLQFVRSIEEKGWRLPADDAPAGQFNALFYGFQAIALRLSGKDSSEAERMMRQLTGEAQFTMLLAGRGRS